LYKAGVQAEIFLVLLRAPNSCARRSTKLVTSGPASAKEGTDVGFKHCAQMGEPNPDLFFSAMTNIRAIHLDAAVNPSTSQPASCAPPCVVSSAAEQSQWFVDEVHAHDSQLKAYLRNSFPRVRDVDDVVQESYLRMWSARATQPIRSAKAFLFQVARRLALDFVRREQVSPIDRVSDLSVLRVIEHGTGVAETVSRNEKIRLLANAIDTLPARCREIFILRRLKCIPQKDVAARLGLSERTVEVQVLRGLRRCEDYLRARGVRGFFNDEAE
jgi:RNA polymerase sigma-70 factor (ECF subfamily)